MTLTGDLVSQLFSETQSRFLVTVKAEDKVAFEEAMTDAVAIGTVTAGKQAQINANNTIVLNENIDQLNKVWQDAIPNLLKSTK